MPELPEVEAARAAVERSCCGKRIERVDALEQGGGRRDGQFDDYIIQVEGPEVLEKALVGRVIRRCHRKGKNLWLEFDEPPHIAWHFGMTGSFLIKGEHVPVYKRVTFSGDVWPPKFTKVRIYFEDGTELAYVDNRRLGKVRVQNDPPNESPIADLALDPALEEPTDEALAEVCRKANTAIKNVLLDQERVYCGIGNWLADEVLYQAGIHPAVLASSLTPEQITRLREMVAQVCRTAVAAEGDADRFPKDWLFHHRWEKRSKEKRTTVDGHPITFLTVGGRTSAVVLARQSAHGAPTVETKEVEPNDDEDNGEPKAKKAGKRKARATSSGDEAESKQDVAPAKQRKKGRPSRKAAHAVEEEASDEEEAEEEAEEAEESEEKTTETIGKRKRRAPAKETKRKVAAAPKATASQKATAAKKAKAKGTTRKRA